MCLVYFIFYFFFISEKNSCIFWSKPCTPWSDATFCHVLPGLHCLQMSLLLDIRHKWLEHMYHKKSKKSEHPKNCRNYPKYWTSWLYHWVLCAKDVNGIADSVDPDQTAPRAVWSGSALSAQACLSENLGSLHRRTSYSATQPLSMSGLLNKTVT